MKLRLPLLLTLLTGLLLMAPAAAHAQSLLFDWVGYDFESPNPNTSIFGEAGSGYTAVGFVNGLFAPLAADTVTNQYTFVLTGLTPDNRQTSGTFVIVDYSVGTMNIYEDNKVSGTLADYGVAPPNATSPSSFNDGALFLQGQVVNFQYILNTATGSGSFSAYYTVTGGAQYNNFSVSQRTGWTFAGTTGNAVNIPAGYQHQVVGQNLIEQVVSTHSSSWGRLKASYR
jgi:hypothetical protein